MHEQPLMKFAPRNCGTVQSSHASADGRRPVKSAGQKSGYSYLPGIFFNPVGESPVKDVVALNDKDEAVVVIFFQSWGTFGSNIHCIFVNGAYRWMDRLFGGINSRFDTTTVRVQVAQLAPAIDECSARRTGVIAGAHNFIEVVQAQGSSARAR